eukprot:3009003-Prymnesium_polylepis.1
MLPTSSTSNTLGAMRSASASASRTAVSLIRATSACVRLGTAGTTWPVFPVFPALVQNCRALIHRFISSELSAAISHLALPSRPDESGSSSFAMTRRCSPRSRSTRNANLYCGRAGESREWVDWVLVGSRRLGGDVGRSG